MPRTSSAPRHLEPLERRMLLSIMPVGGEFAVNTHTPNHQVWPRTAVAADGSFVVVWSSLNQLSATSAEDVFARRYTSAGIPLTGELLVNTFTTGYQGTPAVAMDHAGSFVVVWESAAQDGSATGIYAQRFSADAQRVGNEFRVNTYTGGDEAYPAVAMDADGDFIVTWDTHNPSAGALYDVYAQRFNSQGQPQGGENLINTAVAGDQYSSTVAMDDDGNFVVLWQSTLGDGSEHGIFARRFDPSGQALGAQFQVSTYTTGNQLFPSVAMDADGDFVAVWQSAGRDGSDTGIAARRFNASGAPVGDEFIVNTYTTAQQEAPAVAIDAGGNFMVVWESFGPDQSLLGIRGRAFRADGLALGPEFAVNTHVINDQAFAHIAMNRTGDAAVVWQSRFQDGSENGIFAQRYRLDLIPPTVDASDFRYQTSPHLLRFTFSENVSTSLSADDLTVVNIIGGPPIPTTLIGYDTITSTATFSLGGFLSDGQYRATLAASGITDAAGIPLAADHLFDFFFLLADANHDARVNLADFNILAANFGQSGPQIDFTKGDFNYDGVVNLQDFNILAGRFGMVLGPTSAAGRGGLASPAGGTRIAGDADDWLRELLA